MFPRDIFIDEDPTPASLLLSYPFQNKTFPLFNWSLCSPPRLTSPSPTMSHLMFLSSCSSSSILVLSRRVRTLYLPMVSFQWQSVLSQRFLAPPVVVSTFPPPWTGSPRPLGTGGRSASCVAMLVGEPYSTSPAHGDLAEPLCRRSSVFYSVFHHCSNR